MRIVVKYTIGEKVKYISHLDFMRAVQRALRRAEIPVAYSKGFNPHPRLSFASALAVGTTSEGEYLDIVLEREMDPQILCYRMNEKLPEGIRFLKCVVVDEKAPSLMSLIKRGEYIIKISAPPFEQKDLSSLIKDFLEQREILMVKKTKKGNRQIDIRSMIHNMDLVNQDQDWIIIKAMLSTGSKANLRPDQLAEALLDFAKISYGAELQLEIHRLDLYLFQDGKWVTPVEME
ncbi:MAG: TIGR03936 family radical SAM-associated protein [Caldicoprobacterales bacterium]